MERIKLREDDDELEPVEGEDKLDLDVIEFDDEAILALTQYLEDRGEDAAIVRKYPTEERGYNSHVYENLEDNSEWLVCTHEEAEYYARESLESLVDDLGPVEAFGMDTVEYYIDDDYFDDLLREDVEWRVDNMDEDEYIQELEDYNLIDEDDMVEDPDWEADPDNPDEEPEMIYPQDLLDSLREDLIDKMADAYSGGYEYMQEIYGAREMEDYIKDHPECVDTDAIISNIIDMDGPGNELASYDGKEHELEYEDEYGSTKFLYAYRIN